MRNDILHEALSFRTVRDVMEYAGETYPEKNAYSYKVNPSDKEVVQVTFKQMRDDVRALACELSALGVPGKHCAVIGKLSYDFALVYYAVMSVGGVLVPLDKDWKEDELIETAKKAKAEFLFFDEDIQEKGNQIAAALPLLSPAVVLQAKTSTCNIPSKISEGKSKFDGNPDAYFNAPIDPLGLSLLVFTSGTTGKGKGVMLSQNAIISDMCSAFPVIDYSEKTIGVLPPHHTYGSSILILAHAIIGAEIYVSSDLRYITRELKEQKPGHLVLVPLYLETFYRKIQSNVKEQGKTKLLATMMKISNFLLKLKIDLRKKLFSSIREVFGGNIKLIVSGGAPINQDIVSFFESLGIQVLNGYGITECAPIIAVNHSKHIVDHSVGYALDIDEVKIDEPNEDGEGEILVKGPNVMLGYYEAPEATAEAIDENGFFHTGDYGKIIQDGVLCITGRKKNLIILSNGKNVYPEEIESELISVPGISEIVVYEGKSKRGLEYNAIVAEIYPDQEFIKKNGIEDINAYFKPFIDDYNKNAVPYKKITQVRMRETDFPKNTLRKIIRFKIDMTID